MEGRCWEEWSPVAAMLAVDVAFGVMNSLAKRTVDDGANFLVFITLRQLVATVFMAAIAYYRERESRPKLTARALVYLFFSALLGLTLVQYLFIMGLRSTSATFACAFLNMMPVVTFLFALPFRLETLNLRSTAGQAKVLRTVVCVGSAIMLTLYKGVALTHAVHPRPAPKWPGARIDGTGKWTLGTVALFGACFSWFFWFLLQSKVGKQYPSLYSGTALTFFLSLLQSAALTFATRSGASLLAMRGKVAIISIVYTIGQLLFIKAASKGVVGSGIGSLVMSWCVKKRGPLFPAAFSPRPPPPPPVQIVVAIIDCSILHEPLHLGSVLGSVLVMLGLYVLLWGKNKEAQKCEVPEQQAQGNLPGDKGIRNPV